MAGKLEGTDQGDYDEFEPCCRWRREETRDTLIIELPDFKREQFRVHINNSGILKISGTDTTKRVKLYKEVKVPNNCNINGIQAQFTCSHLYIIMPKRPADQAQSNTTKEEQLSSKMVVNAGMAMILMAAISAFVAYMYKAYHC